MTDALREPLALWRRGLSIFPIPAPRPDAQPGQPGDGKTPALAWATYQTRRPTETEIRGWYPPGIPMNVAIVTGAVSGVIAIDCDTPEALAWATRHLPYTCWQTQTARGFHLFYRHPGADVRNRARIETEDGRLAIDVRGCGGFVVGPGSTHASGARYVAAGDWTQPREALPMFSPAWLARPAARPTALPRAPRSSGDLTARGRAYLAAIPAPQIGQGSDVATLSAACRLVRGFDLAETDATALLWEWAGNRPGWTFDWIAAKVRHAARYGSEPIGALR